ncbi:hypothetical protein K432DRAFT_434643 [Lepidopterella palustris CBS 459.81]|uniref:Uncharacterized protein n=1 Tax=Lepidopterella palustris CBS 459.81 TaxID=1314670 RepID=A0A8E2JFD5_9PEZI|nr:hypothetical protein K432DRAFT_434643 [Lepidopterella palustris CBS 459.81]
MHDEHPHPLLAQLPLTHSPFLSLPTATTLPYTYKSLPSTLPPSVTITTPDPANPQSTTKASYVHPPHGGPPTHPDSILTSCRALQAHLLELERSARQTVGRWEEARKQAELAEKRRVAPGWLDEDVRLLVPERAAGAADVMAGAGVYSGEGGARAAVNGGKNMEGVESVAAGQREVVRREGEELDRAFGGLGIGS